MLRALVLYACICALVGLGMAGLAARNHEAPILGALCLLAGVILLALPGPPRPPADDPIILPIDRWRRGA